MRAQGADVVGEVLKACMSMESKDKQLRTTMKVSQISARMFKKGCSLCICSGPASNLLRKTKRSRIGTASAHGRGITHQQTACKGQE